MPNIICRRNANLEERKLLAEFGEESMDYQQRVSMLFPVKWVIKAWRSNPYP